MKSKIFYGLILLGVSLVSCTSQPGISDVSLNPDSRIKVVQRIELISVIEDLLEPSESQKLTLDVSPGKTSPASIAIKLPTVTSNSFQTAVFSQGSDIRKLKVALVSNNAGVLTPVYGPFLIADNLPNCTGAPTTPCKLAGNFYGSPTPPSVLFINVPPGSFYVAAAAYSTNAALPAANITNLAAPGSIGGEKYYVTNGGGEAGFPGRVTVNADYTVSGTAQLTMNLKLLD
ncbi:MAG: hypothetical protein ACAI44_06845 [Candidatus Sericytochromatia bacterium]